MRLLITPLLGSLLISACKSAPDHDPHQMHEDPNSPIYFLILGSISVIALLYFSHKLMSYLDRRRAARLDAERAEKDQTNDQQ